MTYSFKKDSLVNPEHYLLSSFIPSFASELLVKAAVGRNAGQVMHWGAAGNSFCFWPSLAQPVPSSAPRSSVVPS